MSDIGWGQVLKSKPRPPAPTARLILDTLDTAKGSPVTHLYGGNQVVRTPESDDIYALFSDAGWEQVEYWTWRLPDDVYDLLTSRRFLAEREGRLTKTGRITDSFISTFARSVRELSEAHRLVVEAADLPNAHERRFVRRGLAPVNANDSTTRFEFEVMATLDAARDAQIAAAGSEGRIASTSHQGSFVQRFLDAGWERIDFNHFRVPDDVYDTRACYAFLETIRHRHPDHFSDTVRTLCERGLLVDEAPDLPKSKNRRYVKRGGV